MRPLWGPRDGPSLLSTCRPATTARTHHSGSMLVEPVDDDDEAPPVLQTPGRGSMRSSTGHRRRPTTFWTVYRRLVRSPRWRVRPPTRMWRDRHPPRGEEARGYAISSGGRKTTGQEAVSGRRRHRLVHRHRLVAQEFRQGGQLCVPSHDYGTQAGGGPLRDAVGELSPRERARAPCRGLGCGERGQRRAPRTTTGGPNRLARSLADRLDRQGPQRLSPDSAATTPTRRAPARRRGPDMASHGGTGVLVSRGSSATREREPPGRVRPTMTWPPRNGPGQWIRSACRLRCAT